jgi:hypothetical protein
MVRARSSPGEWIAAASASTPMWGTAVRWLTQTGGHRRGKRGGCALDWSGGGAEGGKGGDDGAQSLLKRHGGGAEDGGGVWPEAAPRDEEVGEGPGPTGRRRAVGNGPTMTRVWVTPGQGRMGC